MLANNPFAASRTSLFTPSFLSRSGNNHPTLAMLLSGLYTQTKLSWSLYYSLVLLNSLNFPLFFARLWALLLLLVLLSYGFGSAATDLNSQNEANNSFSIIQVI
jgi:hypothetical protein